MHRILRADPVAENMQRRAKDLISGVPVGRRHAGHQILKPKIGLLNG
jgi:hypothetical protein